MVVAVFRAVGDVREAQGNADNPAGEFLWWAGLKWCQFARSCPCAGEISTEYDHDPLARKAATVRGSWSYSVLISPAHGQERANWHHFSLVHHWNSPAGLSALPWDYRMYPTARKAAITIKQKAQSSYSYAQYTTRMTMQNRQNSMTIWKDLSIADLASRNYLSVQMLTATSESAHQRFETW